MKSITYKYKVGDIVELKPDHYFRADSGDLVIAAEITDTRDYNGACYRLAGHDCFWKEACFKGLATEPINHPYRTEAPGLSNFYSRRRNYQQ